MLKPQRMPAGVVSLRVCRRPAGRSSIFTVEIKWMTGTIRKKQKQQQQPLKDLLFFFFFRVE